MGAIDTNYTFTATDVITSTKMNNILDQSTVTASAIFNNTLDISSGKLLVKAGGITSNELGSSCVTQGKLATNVVGNGPLARASSSSSQSITANVATKVTLVEGNDTNNDFNSSSFTCSVAGYYMINGSVSVSAGVTFLDSSIRINGSSFTAIKGNLSSATGYRSTVADVLYLNASDYIELWVSGASNFTLTSGILSVAMIRSA